MARRGFCLFYCPNVQHLHEEARQRRADECLRQGTKLARRLDVARKFLLLLLQAAGAEGQDINALLGDETVVRYIFFYHPAFHLIFFADQQRGGVQGGTQHLHRKSPP